MRTVSFNVKKYYEKENTAAEYVYNQTLKEIEGIQEGIREGEKRENEQLTDLLYKLSEVILKIAEVEKRLDEEHFQKQSFEELKKNNLELYAEFLPETYENSYVNPTYTTRIFGQELGQTLAFFSYLYFRSYLGFAYKHKLFQMVEYNQLFIDVYKYSRKNKIDITEFRKLVTRLETQDRTRDLTHLLLEYNDPEYQFYTDIVLKEELDDLRYLFKLGKYISPNEIRMAEFLKNYETEKLSILAKTLYRAFLAGFERDGKKLENKTTVAFEYSVGMERLVREMMREFEKHGLKATVGDVKSSDINQQVSYDHKFYRALFLNEEINEKLIKAYNQALGKNEHFLQSKAGTIAIISFGEKPFDPENKPESLKLSDEQTKLFQKFYTSINQNYTKYQPISETSFSVISFPSPDIGDNFEELFREIVKINMLDSDRYEKIQQIMIDVLDQADHVLIKGRGDNQTDLVVKLQPINNPETETNFVNSGANVNIPAGEIFTSPQLKGTNGILHVKETYQNSVLLKNLVIEFKEGYVNQYSCTSFDTEEKNKYYVEENLLFPHKTLPMGEFAIGTNTLAYVIARKYEILDVLPILITEKTAPHFAVGDTCFQMREEVKSYNKFNKKLIAATDNEKSILRKTEHKEDAYTFKHNDIVLPFDEIQSIIAITEDGNKITIIQEGKFILEGTEELNQPLIEFEKEKDE